MRIHCFLINYFFLLFISEGWFSWNAVHECEAKFLPEFFDGRSPSKNPRVYKYYRNTIIGRFRENPSRKITFTEVRKTIVGDVGSIRRVFDFLDSWGLINYVGSNSRPQLKWEDKDNKSTAGAAQGGGGDTASGGGADVAPVKKRVCSGCKTPCTIACFSSEKVLNSLYLLNNLFDSRTIYMVEC